MSLIPLKRRHTRKPNYPAKIDWSNPLSKGLVSFWLANESGGDVRDLVNSTNNGVFSGTTTASRVVTREGMAINFDKGNEDEIVQHVDAAGLPTGTADDLTIELLLTPYSYVSLATYWGFGETHNPTTSSSFNQRFIMSFNNNWYWWGGADDWDTGISFNTDGSHHHVVFTYEGSTGIRKFYLDGVYMAQVTNAWDAVADDSVRIAGGHHGAATSGDFDFHLGRIYNTVKTDAEIKALNDNPYQILQPQTQYIEAGAAAAGGFNPFWAANSTIVQSMQGMS